MSCVCYICASQESSPCHSSFVRSSFTQQSCVGNLYIHDYFISCEQSYLGFRLNRFLSIHACDSVLVFPTWTIEDCLFIEIYQNTTLLGLGKLFLAQCSFEGLQNIADIEWFTDITPQVSINMSYQPTIIKNPNCVAVYRETLAFEEADKLHLKVKSQGNESIQKIKDFSLAFKDEIWQLVVVDEIKSDVELVLEGEGGNSSLILPRCKGVVPVYSAIATPGIDGNLMALYVVPFFSYFSQEPSNSVFVQIQKISNVWIDSLPEGTVFNIALKSTLFSEGVSNEVSLPLEEFSDTFEYKFISFTPEDKIVIKCLEDGKLSGVGILKLKELTGISEDVAFQTSAQIGYNSCQFWITCKSRPKDENAVKLEGKSLLNQTSKRLTFKDPIFLDVLELLEYKINKMKKKNTLESTQINKVNSKNEYIKKKILELERAPNLNDYKNNTNKKGSKPETVKKESYEGICGCGRPNPKFKGYCEECVKNIKATYERVYNWFSPIEKKHSELEKKFISINGKKILLEMKIKRLEERVSRPVELKEDDEIESAKELAANLRKIQEEIQSLQQDTENTANMYMKQQDKLEKEIEKNLIDKEKAGKDIENLKKVIVKNEETVEEAKERIAPKQYFNDKYS